MLRSKPSEKIATVPATIDSLLELARSKSAELHAFLSEDACMAVPSAVRYEIATSAGFAQEIALLLRSVESLLALQEAARCPQCGYEFLKR